MRMHAQEVVELILKKAGKDVLKPGPDTNTLNSLKYKFDRKSLSTSTIRVQTRKLAIIVYVSGRNGLLES